MIKFSLSMDGTVSRQIWARSQQIRHGSNVVTKKSEGQRDRKILFDSSHQLRNPPFPSLSQVHLPKMKLPWAICLYPTNLLMVLAGWGIKKRLKEDWSHGPKYWQLFKLSNGHMKIFTPFYLCIYLKFSLIKKKINHLNFKRSLFILHKANRIMYVKLVLKAISENKQPYLIQGILILKEFSSDSEWIKSIL